jgi:hypothetical protein
MKRYLILILILAMAATAVLPAAAADECPAPKIRMMPTKVTSDLITQGQGDSLNDYYANSLRNANPGLRILGKTDVAAVLNLSNQQLLLGDDINGSRGLEASSSSIGAEYLVTLTVGTVGSVYQLQMTIIDTDLGTAIYRDNTETTSVRGLLDAVDTQVAKIGDLSAFIESYEAAHPAPPRAPSISVSIRPESVTPEKSRDTTTITVTVRNCKGDVVPGTKVYFEPYPARGRVTTEAGESEEAGHWGWQVATTGDDGTARAIYHLDTSKGTAAGHDTVDIITVGRGQKNVHATAKIPINGVYIEVIPLKDVIGPKQSTDIYISLFELSGTGEKTPLGGKVLYIDESRLPNDAGVVVMGPTDSGGNPITAADGTVVLKFVAGEEERLNRIRILYTDSGTKGDDGVTSPVPVEAWAEIEVKADEYVATVNWRESGSLDYEYSWQYDYYQWDYEYDFTLFTQTQKEKNTGQETTDGTFTYTNDLTYYTEGRTMFDTPFSTGYAIVPFEEQWDVNANVKGAITSYETINTALEERLSTLFIPVTPFPIPFDVSGGTGYKGSITYKLSGENQITDSGDGSIANTKAIRVLGSGPQTGIMGDTLAMVSSEHPDYSLTMMLKHMSGAIDKNMEVSDPKITGLLTKAGENVYAKRWSVHESNSYHADLFTWLSSTARMDMDAEFTREVTLGAVKQ